jgi:hypothetical protein
MKEYLRELIKSRSQGMEQRNLVREYLQARILECLQYHSSMANLAFQGGTALRFFYNIPRFSEDLDFALEQPDGFDFPSLLNEIRSTFNGEGYELDIRLNEQHTVQSAMLRFPGLLFELGLSPMANENLSVKFEIDTHPPAGAGLEIDLIRRHIPLRIQHHDRASLFAGKLHAIFYRPYTKGRDLYDLMWYLSDPTWPEPNMIFLVNALEQVDWKNEMPTSQTWREMAFSRLQQMDWKAAMNDVRPFLERPRELELLTLKNFGGLLSNGRRKE